MSNDDTRRNAHRLLNVAVERVRNLHQPWAFVGQGIFDAQFRPLWMSQLLPGLLASLRQPYVEDLERLPSNIDCIVPNLSTPVLNVLLNDAFLPAGRSVAEFRLEEIVAAHCVDSSLVARPNAAATAQAGNDNWTVLQQSGVANQYAGYQAGQYNRSIAVQNGSGNEATVTQIGNSMSSQVTQLGTNNEISILQNRNGSGLSVTQTGGARAAVLMK
ncbi:curlin minor subunit CsgB [Caballeronia glebae]|uniref:Curlin minor subunit CsgB n=1 Tax=Caballeronia glebae TaxID=1777143 RepID=A0A158CDG7_9BURK|nr:curlin minor subunit CsgB [Caballeronia glebae]